MRKPPEEVWKFLLQQNKYLYDAASVASSRSVGYVFAVNAGSAVALLTYMGATGAGLNAANLLSYSLAFLFFGVCLVGVHHFMQYDDLAKYYNQHRELLMEVSEDPFYLDLFNNQPLESREQLAEELKVSKPLVLSFLCFMFASLIAGGHFGLVAPNQEGRSSPPGPPTATSTLEQDSTDVGN